MPFNEKIFWNSLTKTDKRWIEAKQTELFESGDYDEEDFIQQVCRREAIKQFRKEHKYDGRESLSESTQENTCRLT